MLGTFFSICCFVLSSFREYVVDFLIQVGLFTVSFEQTLTPELYSTFWSLTLYDVHVPKENYRAEISRLRALRSESRSDARQDESLPTAPGDKKKLVEAIEMLEKEVKEHEAHQKAVIARLTKRKTSVGRCVVCARTQIPLELFVSFSFTENAVFVNTQSSRCFDFVSLSHSLSLSRSRQFFVTGGNKMDIVVRFLERCILPRCTASQSDAIFAARFPFLLQAIDVDEFKMLVYISFICRSVGQLVFSCTEAEAERFGR